MEMSNNNNNRNTHTIATLMKWTSSCCWDIFFLYFFLLHANLHSIVYLRVVFTFFHHIACVDVDIIFSWIEWKIFLFSFSILVFQFFNRENNSNHTIPQKRVMNVLNRTHTHTDLNRWTGWKMYISLRSNRTIFIFACRYKACGKKQPTKTQRKAKQRRTHKCFPLCSHLYVWHSLGGIHIGQQ